MSVGGAGLSTDNIFGSVVTVNYFTALGAVPAAGRLFDADDSDQPGASPVTVLSHGLWTRRFDKDPTIVGSTLRLNGHPFTVVGVASEGFHGTGVRALDVWVPTGMVGAVTSRGTLTDRAVRGFLIGGRLKPGVSIARPPPRSRSLARRSNPETRNRIAKPAPLLPPPGTPLLLLSFSSLSPPPPPPPPPPTPLPPPPLLFLLLLPPLRPPSPPLSLPLRPLTSSPSPPTQLPLPTPPPPSPLSTPLSPRLPLPPPPLRPSPPPPPPPPIAPFYSPPSPTPIPRIPPPPL